MFENKHSVSLEANKCKGCTNCLKRCPTEAIRIRSGRAVINTDRCIDCGECIRVCPYRAKRAIYDPFECINDFKYKIALPAPALYGQFDNLDDLDYVLTGLIDIGFDDVFEVARAAELVSEYTRKYLRGTDVKKPVISSACPAVVRLISVRFPSLCENVLPLLAPIELAARMAKDEPLPPPSRTIPLNHPSAPAPSILHHASNLDWRSISHIIIYMFKCPSTISSHLHPLPQSPKDCSVHLCLFCYLAYRVIIIIYLNYICMH